MTTIRTSEFIQKSKPGIDIRLPVTHWYSNPSISTWDNTSYTTLHQGGSTIRYKPGPKTAGGHVNWKWCSHTYDHKIVPGSALLTLQTSTPTGGTKSVDLCPWPYVEPADTRYPTMPSLSSHMDKFYEQVDLNCHDSVLLYSGVLQAVPLVGGAFKFVSIMNRLARKLRKDFQKKPFTTVLQTAISLDFIDRFVVKPTIDDAQKFLDAHNYVIRVLNTMYERQGPLPVRYDMESEVTSSVKSEEYTCDWNPGIENGVRIHGRHNVFRRAKRTSYILANVAYNTTAVSPVKLWASRMGITKPLESVWDLVPFSFVVDYFTRAGDFISSASERFADQDGLVGHIQTLRDAWTCETLEFVDEIDWYKYDRARRQFVKKWQPGRSSIRTGEFRRYQFNPLAVEPETARESPIRIQLSKVRARTLAELAFQLTR